MKAIPIEKLADPIGLAFKETFGIEFMLDLVQTGNISLGQALTLLPWAAYINEWQRMGDVMKTLQAGLYDYIDKINLENSDSPKNFLPRFKLGPFGRY